MDVMEKLDQRTPFKTDPDLPHTVKEEMNLTSPVKQENSSFGDTEDNFCISGILPLSVNIQVKEEPLEFQDRGFTETNIHCNEQDPSSSQDIPSVHDIKEEKLDLPENISIEDNSSYLYRPCLSPPPSHPMNENLEQFADHCMSLQKQMDHLSQSSTCNALKKVKGRRRRFQRQRNCVPKDTVFHCSLCSYNTKVKRNLKTHMLIHNDEKPHKCNYCAFSTKYKSALLAHLRTHTGDRPYKCVLCSFSATQSTGLKTHLRIHTGEKPYKCSLCSFTANQSFHLKTHMRIHTGEKPFQCQVCPYRCIEKSALNKHMRIHTKEKRFKCEYCNYSASAKRTISNHAKIHCQETKMESLAL